MLASLRRGVGQTWISTSRARFEPSKHRKVHTYRRNKYTNDLYSPAQKAQQTLAKAAIWDTYLNSSILSPTTSAAPNRAKVVANALEQDLDSEWKAHQLQHQLKELLQKPENDRFEVENILDDLAPSEMHPNSELVAGLMEVCLRFELYEKAVSYFVWGRDAGQLPSAVPLLALLKQTKTLDGWRHIRSRLKRDLETYYPAYVEQKDKIFNASEIGRPEVSYDLMGRSQSAVIDYGAITSSALNSKSSSESAGIDWVDFICDPLAASRSDPVVAMPAVSAGLMESMLVRDMGKQESRQLLRKHVGFVEGDRSRRVRDDVRALSDDALLALHIEDTVMLRCVMEELVVRKQPEEAMKILEKEVESGQYPLSHEPFLVMAMQMRDGKSVSGVMTLLELMMKQQVDPDILLLNTLLEVHLKLGRLSEAVALFHKLSSFGVQPNASTITTMINCLILGKERFEFIPLTLSEVLRVAQQLSLPLGDATYTPLLHYSVLAKNFVFAKLVYARIRSPNAQSLSLMLHVSCVSHDAPAFAEFYHHMERHCATHIGYPQLRMAMKMHFRAAQPELFVTALRYQMTRHRFVPTLAHIKSFISAALSYGYLRTALELEKIRNEFLERVPVPISYFLPYENNPHLQLLDPPMPLNFKEQHHALGRRRFDPIPAVDPRILANWIRTVNQWLHNTTALSALEETARTEASQSGTARTSNDSQYATGHKRNLRFTTRKQL